MVMHKREFGQVVKNWWTSGALKMLGVCSERNILNKKKKIKKKGRSTLRAQKLDQYFRGDQGGLFRGGRFWGFYY